MKDYKFLKAKEKTKYRKKTQEIERAYNIYLENKTNESISLWFKVLRGEEIGKEIHWRRYYRINQIIW